MPHGVGVGSGVGVGAGWRGGRAVGYTDKNHPGQKPPRTKTPFKMLLYFAIIYVQIYSYLVQSQTMKVPLKLFCGMLDGLAFLLVSDVSEGLNWGGGGGGNQGSFY